MSEIHHPQDDDKKKNYENKSAKRWLDLHARYHWNLKSIYLGADLYLKEMVGRKFSKLSCGIRSAVEVWQQCLANVDSQASIYGCTVRVKLDEQDRRIFTSTPHGTSTWCINYNARSLLEQISAASIRVTGSNCTTYTETQKRKRVRY